MLKLLSLVSTLAIAADGVVIEKHNKPNVLVGITYWQPSTGNRPKFMDGTLRAFRLWPNVNMRILVATNVYAPEIEKYGCEQVVRPGREQFCNETVNQTFCLSWNTVRILRDASTGGAPSQVENFGKNALVGDFAYDYYIYAESDIDIPPSTFDFWAKHADELYRQGYVLTPMRVEKNLVPGSIKTTDCYNDECLPNTRVLRDVKGSASLYSSATDRNYLQMWNPYGGCFMMTKAQFSDYLDGPMWNYTRARQHSPWGVRETVASGLTWDPRFMNKTFTKNSRRADLYGHTKSISHPKMIVWHQVPMLTVGKGKESARIPPERFHDLFEFEALAAGSAGQPEPL